MIADVKPEEIKFVDKPRSTVKEEIKARSSKPVVVKETKEDSPAPVDVIVEQPTTKDEMMADDNKSKIDDAFKELRGLMIGQNTEKIEAVSEYICCGCCKIETQNQYFVRSIDTDETLFMAKEDSWWCLRNPCLCCDCICWCCHSDCSKQRSFDMPVVPFSLRDEDAGNPEEPVMIIKRDCRSSCFPLCLQSVQVYDSAEMLLGSVHQRFRWWPLCGKFELTNESEEVVYTIYTPCIITTLCCTEAVFSVYNTKEEEVGSITKQFGTVAKEALTDSDKFKVTFPEGASPKMKAVMFAAVILFDYLFYES